MNSISKRIDTIARRWKMVTEKACYEHIRNAFEVVISRAKRQKAHLSLIEFGRKI